MKDEDEIRALHATIMGKFDAGIELSKYERGVYDTLEWILEEGDEPNI